ncbi:hypothetical protein BCR33DRAFT_784461 [Rhizoclosmatium globosum]|uniref:C2H2-type domain-containing protein n=1 Tax=Rhizoclosmatium globosum TaxID=329046 RepID=A0A1Y2CFQ0_9FUNG|nr:hypothetical protein BCR33DRAFT_784461 [Rhizoclosmatium globosum]|eukprot:ORY45727.1 hypothetical protein BCR33DRAFT_784461 [Rhizoclosmatium globosum]
MSLPPVWDLIQSSVMYQSCPSLPSLRDQLHEHKKRYETMENARQQHVTDSNCYGIQQHSVCYPSVATPRPQFVTPPIEAKPQRYMCSSTTLRPSPPYHAAVLQASGFHSTSSALYLTSYPRDTIFLIRNQGPIFTPPLIPSSSHDPVYPVGVDTVPVKRNQHSGLSSSPIVAARPTPPSSHQSPTSQPQEPALRNIIKKMPVKITCEVCGINFSRRNDLYRHNETRHTSGSHKKLHKCDKCETIFSRSDALLRHMKSLHRPIQSSK